MPSILKDSGADLLIYGMGELPVKTLIARLKNGEKPTGIKNIPQTAYITHKDEIPHYENAETHNLFSHEECVKDKIKQAKNFRLIEEESNKILSNRLLQNIDEQTVLVVNPAFPPMATEELDASFELPYMRMPHPKYKNKKIPAYEMIKFSVNIHRGCFGGCSFCTISAHQGKHIVSRSIESILKEVRILTKHPEFKGYLSDLGGPSANMYCMGGKEKERCLRCKRYSCIFPGICKNLNTNHAPLLNLYKCVDQIEGIKRSFIGSGIRYDLLLTNKNDDEIGKNDKKYVEELIKRHVSGRLKIAPEHTAEQVLSLMRKPSSALFEQFKKQFDAIDHQYALNQQLIPYFISGHPGCTQENMAELACKTQSLHFKLEQVQDFTPTPMTLSSEMYYSGLHPYSLEKIHVPKSAKERQEQRKFFFWYQKEYQTQIINDLKKMKRLDLIRKLF